jgi:hypothetical protein
MKYFSPEQIWIALILAVVILGLTGFRMWGG